MSSPEYTLASELSAQREPAVDPSETVYVYHNDLPSDWGAGRRRVESN